MPWEKLGDLGDRPERQMYASPILWTDDSDLVIDRIDYDTIRSALRYNLMGIIPRGESPWGQAPTIRFWMADDAINVSDTCYLTAVL